MHTHGSLLLVCVRLDSSPHGLPLLQPTGSVCGNKRLGVTHSVWPLLTVGSLQVCTARGGGCGMDGPDQCGGAEPRGR